MTPVPIITSGVLFLVPGIVLFLLGFFNRKSDNHRRVQVLAHVVDYTNFTRPHRVTFDYPLPDGSWNRQTKMATFMTDTAGKSSLGSTRLIRPGYQFYVYVDPANPFDVPLGSASPTRVLPILAMVLGAGCLALFLLSIATVTLR